MNKKGFAVAAALLVGAGLTPALPGVGSQAARAEDLNKVDFETSATWEGQTRITGYVRSNRGHAAQPVRIINRGLDEKGHVTSHESSAAHETIPDDTRPYLQAHVPWPPAYRETHHASYHRPR